jgi:hypothetical protein
MSTIYGAMRACFKASQTAVRLATTTTVIFVATASWAAPGITFVATNIVDVTPGLDLWQYNYLISGPLAEFESANLLFASTGYSGIYVISSDASLSPVVTDPGAALKIDGMVTATATPAIAAGTSAALSVQFVWLGTGAPGAQPYELLNDSFNVTSTGVTVSAVPEASSALLMLAGLLAAAPLAARRRKA